MSISEEKFEVLVKYMPQFQKNWVWVKFRKTGQLWIPSFEDLHRLVQPMADCEEQKYPNGRGRHMVAEFVGRSACGESWESLRLAFKIPVRDNAVAIDWDTAS